MTYNTNGMGVNYTNDPDPYEIALINGTNNFVVIDFSSPIGLGDTFATIKLDNVTDGYIVYEGAKGASGLRSCLLQSLGLCNNIRAGRPIESIEEGKMVKERTAKPRRHHDPGGGCLSGECLTLSTPFFFVPFSPV